ncbi:hypothetical protein [Arthrobacter sp. R-11]|uniref:hypothetical protein n=1 Tax=Arthrobacter sp. R-11 TaxID=3404053 RepID=UPI003CF0A329
MSEKTVQPKPIRIRVPGDTLQSVAVAVAGIGLILFLFAPMLLATTITLGGMLLWIVGLLQEIAWNTSPKGRYANKP